VTADIHDTRDWEGSDPAEFPTKVSFATCPKCRRPLLIGDEFFGVDYRDPSNPEDMGTEIWSGPFRLWPAPDRGLHYSVPQPLRDAFSEAQTCFRAKAYTAAAIMCRKTLEGVTKHQGIAARDLSKALQKMRDTRVIDERLYAWADQLRAIGNDAAHGVDLSISRDDAQDALDFTEALVDYLFVFQERFEAFKARRARNAAEPQSDAGSV
jgi:hypothetical protein